MKGLRSHPNPLLPKIRLRPGIQRPRWFYRFCRFGVHAFLTAFWKARVFNRHHEPAEGSVLYISNHQSFLDPMLATYMLQRPGNYMARDSLFRNAAFGALIRSVGSFPVRRGTADTGAIKEALRRLKNNACVLLFAEGTRTEDGRIAQLLPGVSLLAQRAADWTVPVVIDGAYEAWPRHRKLPRPGQILVAYGRPIPQAELRKLKPAELLARIRKEMIALQADLRTRAGRPQLDYDD